MNRREVIAGAGLLLGVLPLTALAQQHGRVWRIGLLGQVPPKPATLRAFREGLRKYGYVEGQNLAITVRWPRGTFEEDPGVAAELVRENVDLIVSWASPATIAARRATSTIPIVMVNVADPIGLGFVANFARPGGNTTGIVTHDVSGKLVEFVVGVVPGIRRIGVVRNARNPAATMLLRETEEAIQSLGLDIILIDASTTNEFENAFADLNAKGAQGVVLLADAALIEHDVKIAYLALKARLPTVFQRRENVEAGGLLSYGTNVNSTFVQAASYVDRILKGALRADEPVSQPTKFDLIVNLKTAKALGLTLPQALLARADEVIE